MDKSWMAWRLPVAVSCLLGLAGCMSQPLMGGGNVPLTNTYWKLQEIAGAPMPDAGAASEAHLILRDDGVVNGFMQCLSSMRSSTTGTWCSVAWPVRAVHDVDIPEPAFFRALENTAGVQMEDRHLRLLDTNGEELAEFEAITQP